MTWRERSRGRDPVHDETCRPRRRPVEAVTFDVTGTLIHCPRLAAIHAEVLARHGLLADDAAGRRRLAAMIPEVWRELSCRSDPRRDRFATHPHGARGFWQDFLARLCQRLELATPSRFAAAELYERFARADAWSLYDDVRPTLARLRRRGLRLGVVSNWDERLPALLDQLGISPWLDAVVYSAAVGVEKPHPEIFRHALVALEVAPEAAIHVGDRPLEDVEGAEAAGMRAWRVDRRRPGAGLDGWLASTLLVLVLLLATACDRRDAGTPDAPPPLETVDLEPPPTFDPDSDPRAAAPSTSRLAGVLPSDFPADLPLQMPASVLDFQDHEKGWSSVTLLSSVATARVRARLEADLRARGWRNDGDRWRKGEREIRLELEADAAGTRYRYVYRRW